ncbi:S8 family peptidase [Paludisphaera rhizosphaerae]|uniref:S8 family peptidase n=1 Tax=Paludisphaera rhizosphaerae TaxID=2711216 RepID=UPI0013EDD386|nr:S8 family serine peptidase [Paludisphaera rhizosphaerae]
MVWNLTGKNSRDARLKHRPAVEQLDVRRLLSTGLGGALSEQAAVRRAAIVERLKAAGSSTPQNGVHQFTAARGAAFARAAARRAAVADATQAPTGTVATGAATAFDPIIGSAQTRSTYGVDGTGLTVAVIDTGVNYNDADLGGGFGSSNKVVAGYDFGDGDADPIATTSQHGTAVAGLIAGSDANHLGVAPGADIVALKVTNSTNTADTNNIANALQWVIDHHSQYNISVVNISLSNGANYARNWFAQDGGVGQRMTQLIAQLKSLNIPVVAATGNSFNGQQGEGFTAVLDNVISVTATDSSDNLLSDAQRLGSALGGSTATNIAAPGSGLQALIDGSNYSTVEGTSFAAPLVSGSIVLLQSIYKSRFGTLPTVDQIKGWLEQGAKSIHDSVTGIDLGRLNVLNSASLIPGSSPSTPVVTTPPSTSTGSTNVTVTPPAQQVLVPPTTTVDYTPVTSTTTTPSTPTPTDSTSTPPTTTTTTPSTPSTTSTDSTTSNTDSQTEPTPTTLSVPVFLNGTAVDAGSLDKAASTTKLARADVSQLLQAMSKWANSSSGSKSVRAWNAASSS